MVVHPDSAFTGTIGGGTLEWRGIALAQAALAASSPEKADLRRFALGPELGQCCGGTVKLLVEAFDRSDLPAVAAFAEREEAGSFATEGTVTPAGVNRRIVDEAIRPGTATLAGGVLREGFGDERRPLLLFGAGHVGRALVLALSPLPFAVTWVDTRPDAFPSHLPAKVRLVRRDDPEAELTAAPGESFVLVMSHSHQLDLALVHAAFAAGRFPYVGLIGSKTKRARFEKRLAEAGIPRERIDALVCPIGIAGITSKAPAVIAAATAAELLVRDEALRVGKGDEKPLSRIPLSRIG